MNSKAENQEAEILAQIRDKLNKRGVRALTDQELLAVFVSRHGKKHQGVMRTAAELLDLLDRTSNPSMKRLCQVSGIGLAIGSAVMAALEFYRRRIRPEGEKISFPTDILPIIRNYADRKQAYLLCTSLNGGNEIIMTRVVSIGLVDMTHVHPREVYADPLIDRASAIIVARNHNIVELSPNKEDYKIVERLKESGEILGVKLLDYLIFNKNGYYSFVQNGYLKASQDP